MSVRVDTCPTCGSHSVQACVGEHGELLAVDHPDRSRRLPDLLAIFTHADTPRPQPGS